MTREQLEHVIRAAAAITGDDEIIEVHDLVLSKYVASRGKDREFNRAAIRNGLVQRGVLLGRLDATALEPALAQSLRKQIEADFVG